MFDSLLSTTSQEVFKKYLCNRICHYEKSGLFFVTQRKPSRATTCLFKPLLTVSKDEWNIKEGTGKSLKNALHVLQYAKRHHSGWSNVEQWKNQAGSLSRYRVTLVWRHQLVSQFVGNWFFLKFHWNFLKAFQVDMKACLGLVIPDEYYRPIVVWENWGWFSSDFTLWATPTSWSSLLWITIVVHDIFIYGMCNEYSVLKSPAIIAIIYSVSKTPLAISTIIAI